MKPHLPAFLVGAILGIAAGVGLAFLTFAEPAAEGSAFLHGFSFQEAAERASSVKWGVLRDGTDHPRPSNPRRVARRFVARATMPEEEVRSFTVKFEQAVEEALPHQVGEARLDRVTGGSAEEEPSLLLLPRYRYLVGNKEGMADVWIVAVGGQVTVMVSLIE